jgi:DNA-directed RNA polymerase subunit H (RpoH/RPB5)
MREFVHFFNLAEAEWEAMSKEEREKLLEELRLTHEKLNPCKADDWMGKRARELMAEDVRIRADDIRDYQKEDKLHDG